MYDEQELLLETFDAHAHLAPDSVDVLARVSEIARTRRRNRWMVQATGASLVTAGLVAGGIALPGLVSGSPTRGHTATVVPASGNGDPTYTQQQELAAFFDAGYVYSDAQQLAGMWHETDVTKVKAEAGLKLLNGDRLPVAPSGTPVPPKNMAVEAFFNAGYDYNDAVTLASMWHESTFQAKIDGGKKLENGEPLPFPPSGGSDTSPASSTSLGTSRSKRALVVRREVAAKEAGVAAPSGANASGSGDGMTPALTAYFNAGYDYADAQQLAALWKDSNIDQVKSDAGQKLLDGDQLPIPPSGDPVPPENRAVEEFFNAGYDYNDAVKLGQVWNVSTYHAKVEGGKKLENGETLPIQP